MSNDQAPKAKPVGARLDAVHIDGTVGPGEIRLAGMQLLVSLVALVGGLAIACLGFVLACRGYQGTIDWSFTGLGVTSKLAKASPGVALVVVGLLIMVVNRFSVTIGPGRRTASPNRKRRAKTTSGP